MGLDGITSLTIHLRKTRDHQSTKIKSCTVVLHPPRLALLQTTDAWFDTHFIHRSEDFSDLGPQSFQWISFRSSLLCSDMTCLLRTLKDGKGVQGHWAVLRRCFMTNEFPARTSSAGSSRQHPTLRVVIKPMFHRILPDLMPIACQNCQGCYNVMVNACQHM